MFVFRSLRPWVVAALLAACGPTGLVLAAEPSGAAPHPTAAPRDTPQPAPNAPTEGSGVLIVNNNPARDCQNAAKLGDANGAGVAQCTQALATQVSQRDLVALYTDRGALHLLHRQYAQAKSDFDAALNLDSTVADAYVDRGAALLGMKRYADAILDIDHGLSLGPDQPEKAYFNRAIADENLDDEKSAYQDYLKASQLNPAWDAPKTELARFNLATAPPAK
jgi:tetratricopeptide (TPR) repeat protein